MSAEARSPVKGTQGWLRRVNDRTALTVLFEHGPITRPQLGDLTELSKPTSAQVISRLEAAGLVGPVGTVSGGRGPKAITYGVRTERFLGVAIDVGPTGLRACLADAVDGQHPQVWIPRPPTSRHGAADDVTDAIAAVCDAGGVARESIRICCVGLQGSFDPATDRLSFADHIPRWRRTRVRASLERATKTTVVVENDVNLAIIAERDCGAGRDVDSFALVWLGPGIGMGLTIGGQLYRGARGNAGEIGWLAPDSSLLGDGVTDAANMEALVGAAALLSLARERGLSVDDFDGVVAALAAGDEREHLLAALAPRIAAIVRPILGMMDPQRVVLGGPTGRAGGEQLGELVSRRLKSMTGWQTPIVATEIAGQPVLRGAQVLLRERIRDALCAMIEADDRG